MTRENLTTKHMHKYKAYTHFNLHRNVVGFLNRFSILSPLKNGVALRSPIRDPPTTEPCPFPEDNIWVFCNTVFWDSLNCCLCFSSCLCFSNSLFFLSLLSSSVSTLPGGPFVFFTGGGGTGGFCCFPEGP